MLNPANWLYDSRSFHTGRLRIVRMSRLEALVVWTLVALTAVMFAGVAAAIGLGLFLLIRHVLGIS